MPSGKTLIIRLPQSVLAEVDIRIGQSGLHDAVGGPDPGRLRAGKDLETAEGWGEDTCDGCARIENETAGHAIDAGVEQE